jgi:hypothetical protein
VLLRASHCFERTIAQGHLVALLALALARLGRREHTPQLALTLVISTLIQRILLTFHLFCEAPTISFIYKVCRRIQWLMGAGSDFDL